MPTILCHKDFINNMMSPNMEAPSVVNKYIYSGKAYPKGEALEDVVIEDQLKNCYKLYEQSFSSTKEVVNMPEGIVYSRLSEITADNIMNLIGHESIVFYKLCIASINEADT